MFPAFFTMGKIIELCQMAVSGIWSAVNFLRSAPGLLVTSIGALIASVALLINSLTNNGSLVSELLGALTASITAIESSFGDTPDMILCAGYALSVDILLEGYLLLLVAFVGMVVALFNFLFIALPAFVIDYFVVKFLIWAAISFLPNSLLPTGLKSMSSVDADFADVRSEDTKLIE